MVEMHEGAAAVLAPGIVDSTGVMVIFREGAKQAAGQTTGWWVAREALSDQST